MKWFHSSGTLNAPGWDVVIAPGHQWHHTGLRVAYLDSAADTRTLPAGEVERVVVPLSGSFTVEVGGNRIHLDGRESVFAGPTDIAYLPVGTETTIVGQGRVAVAEAPAQEVFPLRHLTVADVPVELRGAGDSSRQVHNFGIPGVLDAQHIIVCEVITPAGNWSSYPPHKHDEHVPGVESHLEEIYYFESAPTRGAKPPPEADPFGLFATYSSPVGSIDIAAMVRSGDVALVPHGYHGPAAAAPGYDLYYLNVMAGPAERSWNITDDPAHGWVRSMWQDVDDRLPYSGPAIRGVGTEGT